MKRQKTRYPGVSYRDHCGDRTYYIRYRIRQGDGSFRQVEEVAGRSKRDNMTPAKAAQIRARRIGGEPSNKARRTERKKRSWTISNLWDEYQKAKPDRKEHGADYAYKKYLGPRFGDKQPKDILALDIDRLKRRDLKDKAPQTQAHVLGLLRRIINFGVNRGLCSGPSFKIQLPRVSNQKTEDLTPEQMKKLLEVIDSHITYRTSCSQGAHMMKLCLFAGMRRSEMFRLKWDEIDWHRKNILIRGAKSGRDEIIPMSSYAERLLNEIEGERDKTEYVFPGRNGGQLVDNKKQVNQIKNEAGLPSDFRPLHGLRHVFASGLVSHGVSLDVVSRLLTHKGRSVTHRYAHIRDDALREAAELAGRIVKNAISKEPSSVNEGVAYK